jgi:hypothetical protein
MTDSAAPNGYSVRYDIAIERAPSEVWPHINHFELWNPEYRGATVETLAGTKDAEGQVVSIRKDFGDAFLMKVVKLVPDDQVLWLTWSGAAGSLEAASFIDIRVEPDGHGGTLCRYNAQGVVPDDGSGSFDQAALERMIVSRLDDVLTALKDFAESA